MHRSGTSLAASLLSALGIEMGRELLPPDKNNPRGYFEDIDFLDFQREILSQSYPTNDGGQLDWGWTESEKLNQANFKNFIPSAKSIIDSRAEKNGLWGWKDPRTTLLLDFWDELLDDACYIFVYRFPWDVADSLQRIGAPIFLRNPEYAYHIWNFYNRHLLDFFNRNSERCLLLSTNALQQNPNCLVELLQNKLNLELREANLNKIFERELFSSSEMTDPLIDLVAATSPQCTELLKQFDDAADLSGTGLWEARPLRSRLKKENNPSAVDVSILMTYFDDGQFLIEAVASFERVAPPKKDCNLSVITS